MISFGPGVELEVLHQALEKFRANSARWFEVTQNDFAAIKPMTSEATAAYVPEERVNDLMALGTLVSLAVLNKVAPEPIGPCVLQVAYHGRDIRSLHEDFVKSWHPELYSAVSDWLELGAGGDASTPQFRRMLAFLGSEV